MVNDSFISLILSYINLSLQYFNRNSTFPLIVSLFQKIHTNTNTNTNTNKLSINISIIMLIYFTIILLLKNSITINQKL